MSFLTGLALRRPSVTILVMILVLAVGIFTYRNLERQLFPEIEFPVITIITLFPSANPDAVERDVTEPIEEVIESSGLAVHQVLATLSVLEVRHLIRRLDSNRVLRC